MIDLLQAIRSTFQADSALSTAFPGSPYAGQGPDGSLPPYVIYTPLTTGPSERETATSGSRVIVQPYHIQFAAYSPDGDVANQGITDIQRVFEYSTLSLGTNNTCISCMHTGKMPAMPIDEKVYQAIITYEITVAESF